MIWKEVTLQVYTEETKDGKEWVIKLPLPDESGFVLWRGKKKPSSQKIQELMIASGQAISWYIQARKGAEVNYYLKLDKNLSNQLNAGGV